MRRGSRRNPIQGIGAGNARDVLLRDGPQRYTGGVSA